MHSPNHQPRNEQGEAVGISHSMLMRRKRRIFEGKPIKKTNFRENVFFISPVQCCQSPSCCLRTACGRSIAKNISFSCGGEEKSFCRPISQTCPTSVDEGPATRRKSFLRLKNNEMLTFNMDSPSRIALEGDTVRANRRVSSMSPFCNVSFNLRNNENICSTPVRDPRKSPPQRNASVLETSPIATCTEVSRIKQAPEAAGSDFHSSTPCPGKDSSKFAPASRDNDVPDELQNSIAFDTEIPEIEKDERGLQKLSFNHWLQKEAAEKTVINHSISKMHNQSVNKMVDLCCSIHFEEKLSHHSIIAFDKEEELDDGEVDTDAEFIVQEPHVISLLHESLKLSSRNNTVLEPIEEKDVFSKPVNSTLTDLDLSVPKHAKPSESEKEEEKSKSDSVKAGIGFSILCDPDVQLDQKITDRANDSCEIVQEVKPLKTLVTLKRPPLTPIPVSTENNVKSSVPVEAKIREPFKSLDPMENYDIEHPDWEKIRKLSTDEERYEQVRQCWSSKVIPDPNRDLTRYSFRKKNVSKLNPISDVCLRKHKRQASENIHERPSKRTRTQSVPCTETIDMKIKSMKRKMIKREQDIRSQFHDEMRYLLREQNRAELRFYSSRYHSSHRGYDFQPFYDSYVNAMHTASDVVLQRQHENEKDNLKSKYNHQLRCVENCFNTEIELLTEVKQEINKFCRFYSGLKNENDPTILTSAQLRELDEIENVYELFETKYYDPNI